MPVVAIAVAWVWLGEVPSLISIAGGALALTGVAVTNRMRALPAAPLDAAGEGSPARPAGELAGDVAHRGDARAAA